MNPDRSGVVAPVVKFSNAVDAAIDQIRQHGAGVSAVLIRLLDRLATVLDIVTREEDKAAILRQAKMIVSQAERSLAEGSDLDVIKKTVSDRFY